MKNNPTLIAVICGLLAAVLFLGAFSFGGLGLVLSNFTAFPLFVAVLGFGTTTGIIASVVAVIAVAVFAGVLKALGLTVTTIGPALWIGHMVGLSRDDSGTVEWFPLSALLFRIALLYAAITVFIGWMSGYSQELATEYYSQTLAAVVEFQATSNSSTPLFTAEEISERALLMTQLTPVIVPSWLLLLVGYNLHLGMRFTRKQGWMLRPKDDLPATLALPPIAIGVMGVAVAACFLPAPIGMLAKTVAGAFGTAFMVVGLATVHFLSRGMAGRGIMLALLYPLLLLIPSILPPLMAALGIAETLFNLRARFFAGPSSTSNT